MPAGSSALRAAKRSCDHPRGQAMMHPRAVTLLLLVGCARAVSTGPASPATPTQPAAATRVWPVLTRSHVDLWLHGYAMLLRDSAKVPVFRPGYRDRVQAV